MGAGIPEKLYQVAPEDIRAFPPEIRIFNRSDGQVYGLNTWATGTILLPDAKRIVHVNNLNLGIEILATAAGSVRVSHVRVQFIDAAGGPLGDFFEHKSPTFQTLNSDGTPGLPATANATFTAYWGKQWLQPFTLPAGVGLGLYFNTWVSAGTAPLSYSWGASVLAESYPTGSMGR